MIACEYLSAQAECDGRPHAFGIVGVERPDQLGVAARTLDDLVADVYLAAGAIL